MPYQPPPGYERTLGDRRPLIGPSDLLKKQGLVESTARSALGTLPNYIAKGTSNLLRAGFETFGAKPPQWTTDLYNQAEEARYRITGELEDQNRIGATVGEAAGNIAPYLVAPYLSILPSAANVYGGMRDRGKSVSAALLGAGATAGTQFGAIKLGATLGDATSKLITGRFGETLPANIANRGIQAAENVALGAPVNAAFAASEGRPILPDVTNPYAMGTDAALGFLFTARPRTKLSDIPNLGNTSTLEATPGSVDNLHSAAEVVKVENPVAGATIQKVADATEQTRQQQEAMGKTAVEAPTVTPTTKGKKGKKGKVVEPPVESIIPPIADDATIAAGRETAHSVARDTLLTAGTEPKMADALGSLAGHAYENLARRAAGHGIILDPVEVAKKVFVFQGDTLEVGRLIFPDVFYDAKDGMRPRAADEVISTQTSPLLSELVGKFGKKGNGDKYTSGEVRTMLEGNLKGAYASNVSTVTQMMRSLSNVAEDLSNKSTFVGLLKDSHIKMEAGSDTIVHEWVHVIDGFMDILGPDSKKAFHKNLGIDHNTMLRSAEPKADKRDIAYAYNMKHRIVRYAQAFLATRRLPPTIKVAIPENMQQHMDYLAGEFEKLHATKSWWTRIKTGEVFGMNPLERKIVNFDANDVYGWDNYKRNRYIIQREMADMFGIPKPTERHMSVADAKASWVGKSGAFDISGTSEEITARASADLRFLPVTPREEVETRTSWFKAWFGDWERDPARAGKVVDDEGIPLAVYHGSPWEIEGGEFEIGSGKNTSGLTAGLGTFFTPDPRVANYFTRPRGNISKYWINLKNPFDPARLTDVELYGDAANTIPLATLKDLYKTRYDASHSYLSSQDDKARAAYYLKVYEEADAAIKKIGSSPLELAFPGIVSQIEAVKQVPNGDMFRVIRYIAANADSPKISRELLQKLGYDGIAVNSFMDTARIVDKSKPQGAITQEILPTYQYIIFDPSQAKSALANSGEYSPTNPSYLASFEANPFGPQPEKKRGRKGSGYKAHTEFLQRTQKEIDAAIPAFRSKTKAEIIQKSFTLTEAQYKRHGKEMEEGITSAVVARDAGKIVDLTYKIHIKGADAVLEINSRYNASDHSQAAKRQRDIELDAVNATIADDMAARASLIAHSSEAGRTLAMVEPIIGMVKIEEALSGLTKIRPSRQDRWWDNNRSKVEELFDLATVGGDYARFSALLDNVELPKMREYFQSYYIGNLLSGVHTLWQNLFTNTLWTLHERMSKDISGYVGDWMKYSTGISPKRPVFWSGAFKQYTKDMGASYAIGWQAFKDTWHGDVDKLYRYELGTHVSPWKRSNNPLLETFGRWHDLPLKFLRSTDAFSAESAANMERRRLIMADTIASTDFRVGKVDLQKAYNDRLARHMKYIQTLPSKQWELDITEIENRSREFGLRCVFIDKDSVAAKITNMMTGLRDAADTHEGVPAAMASIALHTAIPFIRIPMGIAKFGMDYSAPFSMFTKHGAYEGKTQYVARQIEAFSMAALFGYAYAQGNLTGAPPDNRAQREALERSGVQWWSYAVSDRSNPGAKYWISYKNAGPIGFVLANAATGHQLLEKGINDALGRSPDKQHIAGIDVENLHQSYIQIAKNLFDFYGDNTWMRSLDIFGGLGSGYGSEETRIKTAFKGIVEGFIPWVSLARDMKQLAETVQFSGIIGAVSPYGKREATQKGFPLDIQLSTSEPYVQSTPHKFNVWGENITLPGGVLQDWFMPHWKYQPAEPDYIEKELLDKGIYPLYPDKKFKPYGAKDPIDIPNDVYQEYLIFMGKSVKDKMAVAIKSPGYRGMSKERQIERLKHARDRGRDTAERMLRLTMLKREEGRLRGK